MKKFAPLLLAALCLQGCDENEVARLNGSFSGTFIYTNPVSSVAPPPSGPVTVTFEGDSYFSTGNPDYIPAGGSGTYEVVDKTSIRFRDTNYWTANFDWGLILNGEYEYEVKGDSLLLTRYSNGFKVYQYKLKRDE